MFQLQEGNLYLETTFSLFFFITRTLIVFLAFSCVGEGDPKLGFKTSTPHTGITPVKSWSGKKLSVLLI